MCKGAATEIFPQTLGAVRFHRLKWRECKYFQKCAFKTKLFGTHATGANAKNSRPCSGAWQIASDGRITIYSRRMRLVFFLARALAL